MFDFWKDELDEQEEEALIEKAANEIRKRRLELPAMLFLESHKPLSYIGANASVVFAPFLVPFLGFDAVNNYSRLMSRRDNIDRLLDKLDTGPKSGTVSTEESCTT
jgi:hypothetical protein